MASVVIAGDVSGTCTLQAANAAGTTVLNLPTTSGTLVATGGDPSFTTVTTGLGNATAPSITFTGDTNTGIFSPTADTIAFTEGGVESMRIDSSGRVGIGTTTPATPLQVNGTITATSVNTNNTFGFKNRIINGAMVIDQRNAGASVTPTNEQYSVDRWKCWRSQASKYSVQQNAGSVTPPTGFTNYLGVTSLSAYSLVTSDYFMISQQIEGFNLADLDWGTANAKTVTLSFKVYSSLTGTFGGSIQNSAQNRSYPFSYTVSSANTWTDVSITITGETTGTWLKTNGIGAYLWFGLGVASNLSGTAGAWASSNLFSATGATSVVGTNGATFYITGVQLEIGSTATSFDYRPYGTELALCQRYYQLAGMGGSYYNTTASQQARFSSTPAVTPRTSPTFALVSSNVVGNVSSALPSSYNSGATLHFHLFSSAGAGAYTDGNYTYSLSAEL